MNNNQFRNLLLANSKKNNDGTPSPKLSKSSSTPALGSRKNSSIPMTPRQVGRTSVNAEFARQLAERNASRGDGKKWKSSAPKGVKLAAGYIDRTKHRIDEETDEVAQRIKALEEAMKLGQIDRATFEKLVQEITGGDLNSTHHVKGLDRKLLERVRRGDDLQEARPDKTEEEASGGDLEDEFDELAEQEVAPMARERIEKKGEMAPPPPVAGVKRNRNAILAELKAQRKAAVEAELAEREKKYAAETSRFHKVGGETSRIEIDAKGREVLIITDANGKEKRKVRKQKTEEELPMRYDLDDPKKPLKIPDPPAPPAPAKEDSDDSADDDIFAGVGSNYNPLDNVEEEEDDSSDEDGEEDEAGLKARRSASIEQTSDAEENQGPSSSLQTEEHRDQDGSESTKPKLPPRRNYFNDAPTTKTASGPSIADATVLAALKKVRTMDPDSDLLKTDEEARLQKRAAMLATSDRDMEDLDMGFGSSRFDDAEEMEQEGKQVKFSQWRGLDDDGDGEEDGEPEGRGGKKRKRGPKKKKGDKNSASDVLMTMERQKGKKNLG